MATLPSPEEVNLPGRVLARSGVHAQIAGAALRLGELVVTSDDWLGWLGDESQNPPHWPTSKTIGDFDWSNLNPKFNNVNVSQINNQKLPDLINNYVLNGTIPVITIINENLVKTVYSPGADFPDLDAAYAWLSQRTISTRGSVTLVFPGTRIVETKTYTITHPNGDRIFWQGAPLKATLPAPSTLQVTGNSAPAQANDAVANLTLLRQSFATELYFTQGGCLNFVGGNLAAMSNILISSDGALGGKAYVPGIVISGCQVAFNNIAITGFDNVGLFVTNSAAFNMYQGSNLYVFGNGGGGITVATNSVFAFTYGTVTIIGNGARHAADFAGIGLQVSDNSLAAAYPYYSNPTPSVLYIVGNAGPGSVVNTATLAGTMNLTVQYNNGHGVNLTSGSRYRVVGGVIANNSGMGMLCDSFSLANMPNSIVTNNGNVGIGAFNGSFVFRSGSTVSGNAVDYSPAVGQTGNTGALMA